MDQYPPGVLIISQLCRHGDHHDCRDLACQCNCHRNKLNHATNLNRRTAMACPTCDHTMQGCGDGCFWCPRCGTLRQQMQHGNWCDDGVPKLVSRCRYFADESFRDGMVLPCVIDAWTRTGIRESINKPEDR